MLQLSFQNAISVIIKHADTTDLMLVKCQCTLWVKKTKPLLLLPVTLPNVHGFSNSFTCGFSSKFAIKSSWNIGSICQNKSHQSMNIWHCVVCCRRLSRMWSEIDQVDRRRAFGDMHLDYFNTINKVYRVGQNSKRLYCGYVTTNFVHC